MIYDLLSNVSNFLYSLSPWLVSLWKIAVLLLSLEIGYRVGLSKLSSGKDTKKDGSEIILNSTLALLGLILAFTFSASVQRNDIHKKMSLHVLAYNMSES